LKSNSDENGSFLLFDPRYQIRDCAQKRAPPVYFPIFPRSAQAPPFYGWSSDAAAQATPPLRPTGDLGQAPPVIIKLYGMAASRAGQRLHENRNLPTQHG
jgi:hypothetical protein